MDADTLVARACASAGLDDFGSDSYRDGLDRLVHALNAEAALSELGVLALEDQITTNLVNRLRVTDWHSANPGARNRPVERPIVVLGLPRTGTTLLSELLHRDPANRSLMRWEAQHCVPPPRAADLVDDPRIEAARESQAAMDALNPGFRAIHYEAPDGPTECVAVLAQDFKSLLWAVVAHVPSYARWLLECDQASAYEYHHDVLALLQSEAPGRWALKTPHHSLALDALVGRYPDARLVMTHRDPVTVVASLCSLARALAGTFSDTDHTAASNGLWADIAEAIVERVMRWRDLHGDARWFDTGYDALVADPVGTVRAAYAHFGEELSPAAEAAMNRYVAEHPRGEHGPHDYGVAALGLDRAALAARFSPYRERFDIAPAGRA